MSQIAYLSGQLALYWPSLILALGLAAGLCLSLALYPRYNRHSAALWVFFPFALLLGLFCARVVYWFCHLEQFSSFWQALIEYNVGGYALFGVILGVWAAALIVRRLGLVQRMGRLLDAVAPGLCLSFAFIRLSALWGGACRSRITVPEGFFRRLPFAVPGADASGAGGWPLAVFFYSFVLLLVVTLLLVRFYLRYRRCPMVDGSRPNGNVFRLFLLLWGLTEIVIDSLRYDSCFMHFIWLKQLNPYASFVSLGQIFAAMTILAVLIRFTTVRVRGHRGGFGLVLAWLLYLASLVGVGYFGEYKVQRSANYALCYPIQIVSLLVMAGVVWWVYKGCLYREDAEARGASRES